MLDLRALTNMRGGRLKVNHQESSDYADELKQIDTYQTSQDSQRVLLMPHGASTYTSVVLDLVQDACALFWAQSAPMGVPAAAPGATVGASAADIAAAMAAVNEASKLETNKECTPTYEQGRHAKIVGFYNIELGEDEHGNRNALYKANKWMGPSSSHHYPSPDQMHFMKLVNAQGGGVCTSPNALFGDVRSRSSADHTSPRAPLPKSVSLQGCPHKRNTGGRLFPPPLATGVFESDDSWARLASHEIRPWLYTLSLCQVVRY